MDAATLASSLRAVIASLHKGLRQHASSSHSYSMTELETIGHLARNASLLPTELAALTHVKTQTMSQILKKLEADDMIVRTPSNNDRRKVFISLTTHGAEMVANTKYAKDEWLKELIEQALDPEERKRLESALPVLDKLLKVN